MAGTDRGSSHCRPALSRPQSPMTSDARRAECSGWVTIRSLSACPAYAGTPPNRSSKRNQTAASRDRLACRRNGLNCVHLAWRTGFRPWPWPARSAVPGRPAVHSRAGRRLLRTKTSCSRPKLWRRPWRWANRNGRSHRPPNAGPGPAFSAPLQCAGSLRSGWRRRFSFSPPSNRGLNSFAFRRSGRSAPCLASSSHRRHTQTLCDSLGRCHSAQPAIGTAACPRSWPPHPKSPCPWCPPRPSAHHDRQAFRWSSSWPKFCAGPGCLRLRQAGCLRALPKCAG